MREESATKAEQLVQNTLKNSSRGHNRARSEPCSMKYDKFNQHINNIQQQSARSPTQEREKTTYVMVSHFKIDAAKVLGVGTWAVVRPAIDKRTGKKVAAKIVGKRKLKEGEHALLLKEIHFLETCKHENIVQLVETFEDDRNIYLFTDMMEGGDLEAVVTHIGPLPEEFACNIFTQIVSAVEYLHHKKIAHRDIKLENVLLDSTFSKASIIDFGLSAYMKKDKMKEYCGSPYYAAPELISHTPYRGDKVDMWALGVLLYTMLHRKFPFDGQALDVMYTSILTQKPVLNKELSPEAQDLIRSLLSKNPAERPSITAVKNHPWLAQYRK